jgi:glycosyltransferase involved in cell wall biosynthesis
MRGGEKVLGALATLVPDAPIYTLLHVPASLDPALEARAIHQSWIARLPGAHRGYRRYLPLFPSAIEDFDLTGYEVVISTSHCVAKGVIPAPGAWHICYCHSPMRYAWDQEHVYFPRRRGLVARLRNLMLSRLRTWDVASAHRVDLFVANSRFVAKRIRRYYGRDAEVVPPPVALEAFTPRPNDGIIAYENAQQSPAGRRCLMVAALAPYKRIEVAVAACQRLGVGLDVVGTGPEQGRLTRLTADGLTLRGRVEHDVLAALYRDALCFVQPGVEDFGIAAVESLASGTPVVALGRGGVTDIVEDGVHGVLYGQDDHRAGTSAALFEDEVAQLAAAIDQQRGLRFNPLELRDRANLFSTARFLERMRALIGPRIAGRTRGEGEPARS